jgi:hypothetical protein
VREREEKKETKRTASQLAKAAVSTGSVGEERGEVAEEEGGRSVEKGGDKKKEETRRLRLSTPHQRPRENFLNFGVNKFRPSA